MILLPDLSGGCGYIYLRTPNPVVGKNVEIGYYPAPAVIGLTGEYSREWYNESSRSLMTLTEGLLTEEELPNKEFVLTIYNSTRWTTGNYSVKCTKSTTNRLSTERVYVKVTVPPGQPFLQSPNIVQDCPKCLVGILHENLYYHVFCNTSGGTTPSIYVGDEGGTVYNDTQFENIYKISRIIREEDHMKTVTCSVSNAALENPLTTSAKFFVAVKPEVPVLNVPILRDGNPANITCISRGGRPATNLSLWLDEANYSVDHDSYTLKFSCFFNSHLPISDKPSVSLSVQNKVWLNAHDTTSVICTAKSQPLSDIVWSVNGDTQLLVCNKSIECEIHTLPIETDEHRNYICTAYFEFGDYDTIATISFLAIGRASTQKTYEIPNESEDASLTNRNGIPIVWIVIGLSVIIAVVIISTVIVLARKPNVQGNETVEMNEEVTYAQVNKVRTNRTETLGPKTKGSDTNLVYADIDIEHLETASKPPSRERPPSPTEYAEIHTIRTERGSNSDNIITSNKVWLNAHDTTSVTCTAKSLPLSDIVWSVNGDKRLIVCNKSIECEIHTLPIETDEHRNYTCTAFFEFGDYDTSATISFLAIGRGFLKKNQHVNTSEPQPVQHAIVQKSETVEMNEEVTYAQVNKIRKNRTEALGPKTKGSESNLVYADIDIEHLETASKPSARQKPPSPTEYAGVDFIRTEHPPSKLTMDAPSIPSYLQDSYTLKFSCFMDTYNDNCLISWTKDGQLLNSNGEVTNKIHDSAVMEFAASTQKTYETPNESKDTSLTNSNDIPMVRIVIGLSVIIAAVIISTVIVLARKRFLKKNQHANSSEPQPVQHANVQENETVGMNEEVTYAQVNKIRTNRTETVEPKTKGSDTNLVYADIDIEHLETASKPPSRQRPPSPTEYADVDFIRTKRGSKSDNIIT
ncbi:hypothetical protein MAR_028729 [Mya arenaria]|uniref:Ig-like domain-containing protein n=1 Tax=Mya arenaria TaxID=6604 RepID=A0ABY7DFI3_MYAAR|nr:hypothetical protein MAR_028729 [Mya arenaria]